MEYYEGEEYWLDCEDEEETEAIAGWVAAHHAIFQVVMAVLVLAALLLMSGCSFTVQVPNSFEFVTYEDCSWEVVETGMGVQLATGTFGCNDE